MEKLKSKVDALQKKAQSTWKEDRLKTLRHLMNISKFPGKYADELAKLKIKKSLASKETAIKKPKEIDEKSKPTNDQVKHVKVTDPQKSATKKTLVRMATPGVAKKQVKKQVNQESKTTIQKNNNHKHAKQ